MQWDRIDHRRPMPHAAPIKLPVIATEQKGVVQQEFLDSAKGHTQHQLRQPCILIAMGIITICVLPIIAITIAIAV